MKFLRGLDPLFDFSTLLWYTVDKGYIWRDLASSWTDAKVIYMAAPRSEGHRRQRGSSTTGAPPLLYLGMDPPGVGAVKGAPIGAGVEIFSGVEQAQRTEKYYPLP